MVLQPLERNAIESTAFATQKGPTQVIRGKAMSHGIVTTASPAESSKPDSER